MIALRGGLEFYSGSALAEEQQGRIAQFLNRLSDEDFHLIEDLLRDQEEKAREKTEEMMTEFCAEVERV